MFAAIGIIVLLVMVFGGFVLAGGSLGPVLAAMPLELMMIGGAAAGGLLIGNTMHELKLLGGGLRKVFSEYPRLQSDRVVCGLICDPLTLLVVSSGTLDTHAVEDVIDNAIKTQMYEMDEPAHAIQTLADSFPALGIVAAVLGIIKTMGAIDQPPAVLGKMIGGALVGTFLGVLLAYGFAAPMAGRLKQINAHDQKIFQAIK